MHLINSYANTVILHIEVKVFLENNCQSNIENLKKKCYDHDRKMSHL